MQQFLWYTLPGALIVFAIACLVPDFWSMSEAKAILWVAVSPAIGFGIHQAYRLIFETFDGGFSNPNRQSISYLVEMVREQHGVTVSRKEAFLIWEITFYGDQVPQPFREHNRRSWQFIFSFNSTALAAVCGAVAIAVSYFSTLSGLLTWTEPADHRMIALFLFALFALVFWGKGNTTNNSLNEQEVAFIKVNAKAFSDVATAIVGKHRQATVPELRREA